MIRYVGEQPDLDRAVIHAELERSRAIFHALVAAASPEDLSRGTTGTRWTNQQLLFHMLFGYFIVRALLGLVPFFRDSMTLYDVYRYGTQHFDYHRRQLTLPDGTQT